MEENPTSSHSVLTAIESLDMPEESSFCPQDAPVPYFERVIGILEDIVVGQEFQELQNFYLSKYVNFEHKDEVQVDSGQNTYEQFQIFKDYSQEMSEFLVSKLKTIVDTFNIDEFIRQELAPRLEAAKRSEDEGSGEISGQLKPLDNEIFEMLYTLVDFLKFKELLVDHRKMMEGKTPNLTVGQIKLTMELDSDNE